ncbi:MAG: hypothetical protein KDK07_13720 [Bauldia sp.]|nr:hypothetical protein [Bauldia sp.]
MPRYAITEKAGRFVAGHRNIGVGMVLELTEKQAEHELRLGSLVALDTSIVITEPIAQMQPEMAQKGEQSQPIDVAVEAARKTRRGKP